MKWGCPNCGSNVFFMPETQKFHCEHCGVDCDIHQFEDKQMDENMITVNYQECTCSSCGAKLIVGENTTITKCNYCGSNQIIMNRFTGDFKPDMIIPFKINQKEFIQKYQEFIKKKRLAPDSYKNNIDIAEIKGFYVPCYIYELNCSTKASGKGHFDESRFYFKADYSYHYTFLQDASVKLNDFIMTSMKPYHFEEAQKFHPVYLNGFSSENGDIDLDKLEKKAKIQSGQESRTILYKKLKNYQKNSLLDGAEIDVTNEFVLRKYALLPIWFFNIIYQGKAYEYAMNGQTGKVVGNIPISRKKFNRLFILLFLLALLPALLILFLKVNLSDLGWGILRYCYFDECIYCGHCNRLY